MFGQLDDVGARRQGDLTEFVKRIGNALSVGEALRELGENPASKRDIASADFDASGGGKSLHDRQKRVCRQRRRLVGDGVKNCGLGHAMAHFIGASECSHVGWATVLVLYLSTP